MNQHVNTSVAVRRRPEWLDELDTRLATSSQLVLVGAPNELHLLPAASDHAPDPRRLWKSSVEAVAESLIQAGYELVLQWSIEGGLRPLSETEAGLADRLLGGSTAHGEGENAPSLVRALRVVSDFTPTSSGVQGRAALIVEGAERLAETYDQTPLREVFALAQQQALAAQPMGSKGERGLLFNAVVWMVAREHDLPNWFLTTRGVHVLSIPLPDSQARRMVAREVLTGFVGYSVLDSTGRSARARELADLCEGMTQAQMREVKRFAADRGIAVTRMEDAVRGNRSGLRESPWRSIDIRDRLENAQAILLGDREPGPDDVVQRVFGQPVAVRKALDVISRSVLGLSDWDESQHSARPRGVLFFAGPTGVGKTFLAKQLATAILGRQEAMIRFDMSEYSTSHSEARLIGSPPGYVGYESGGQLTNAVRERPFSLLLFDEIDKAHPLVLDKFLQILEDGRLTDGSGSTLHFGETLIVFTSNLGIYQRGDVQNDSKLALVVPGDPYEKVEARVRTEIHRYFTEVLKRPEILNRIGDNVLVFDYLSQTAAQDLLHVKLRKLAGSVLERQGVVLTISEVAMRHLEKLVVEEEHLKFGGRGVKNVVESRIVNPLGRKLLQVGSSTDLTIEEITEDGLQIRAR